MAKCKCLTINGDRCSRNTQYTSNGSGSIKYCYQHINCKLDAQWQQQPQQQQQQQQEPPRKKYRLSPSPSPSPITPRSESPRTPGTQRTPWSPRTSGSGNKILVYGGCFCPPHRGHFENIRNRVAEFDEVYIYLYPFGQGRHGIPVEKNAEIWEIFRKLLPVDQQDKVHISVNPIKSQIKTQEPYKVGLAQLVSRMSRDAQIYLLVGSDYASDRVADIKRWMDRNVCFVGGRQCGIIVNPRTDDMSATSFTRAIRNGQDIRDYLPLEIKAADIQMLNNLFDRIGRKKIYGKHGDLTIEQLDQLDQDQEW